MGGTLRKVGVEEARRQRQAFETGGDLAVVRDVVERTEATVA